MVHVISPDASSDYALPQSRDARAWDTLGCRKMQAPTQIARWTADNTALVIDVSVDFKLVGFSPTSPGRWQCEPAHREPFARSQYTFQFSAAAPDDPDEPALTPHEIAALRCWFAASHDIITEHAADYLRGDGP